MSACANWRGFVRGRVVCIEWACPRPTDRTFCGECETVIASALAELPALHAQLRRELPGTSTPGERVSGTHAAPLPLRVDVGALVDDIEGTLSDHVVALCDARGWPLPGDNRPLSEVVDRMWAHVMWLRAHRRPIPRPEARALRAVTRTDVVTRRARWLGARLLPLLASDAGADAGREILALRSRAQVVLGLANPPERKAVPCPECDRVALIRNYGEDAVRCTACGAHFGGHRYAQLVAMHTAFRESERRRA